MSPTEFAELLAMLRDAGVTYYECGDLKIVLSPVAGEIETERAVELPPGMENLPLNYRNPRLYSHVGGLKGFAKE